MAASSAAASAAVHSMLSLGSNRKLRLLLLLPCHAAVAKLCKEAGVAHIVNNAYGVQSAALCAQVR